MIAWASAFWVTSPPTETTQLVSADLTVDPQLIRKVRHDSAGCPPGPAIGNLVGEPTEPERTAPT